MALLCRCACNRQAGPEAEGPSYYQMTVDLRMLLVLLKKLENTIASLAAKAGSNGFTAKGDYLSKLLADIGITTENHFLMERLLDDAGDLLAGAAAEQGRKCARSCFRAPLITFTRICILLLLCTQKRRQWRAVIVAATMQYLFCPCRSLRDAEAIGLACETFQERHNRCDTRHRAGVRAAMCGGVTTSRWEPDSLVVVSGARGAATSFASLRTCCGWRSPPSSRQRRAGAPAAAATASTSTRSALPRVRPLPQPTP